MKPLREREPINHYALVVKVGVLLSPSSPPSDCMLQIQDAKQDKKMLEMSGKLIRKMAQMDDQRGDKRKGPGGWPQEETQKIAQATTLTGFFLVAVLLALAFAVAVGQ
jgi:hypothetical protein